MWQTNVITKISQYISYSVLCARFIITKRKKRKYITPIYIPHWIYSLIFTWYIFIRFNQNLSPVFRRNLLPTHHERARINAKNLTLTIYRSDRSWAHFRQNKFSSRIIELFEHAAIEAVASNKIRCLEDAAHCQTNLQFDSQQTIP